MTLREYLNSLPKDRRGELLTQIQVVARLNPVQIMNRVRGVSRFKPLEMDQIRNVVPVEVTDTIDWTILN